MPPGGLTQCRVSPSRRDFPSHCGRKKIHTPRPTVPPPPLVRATLAWPGGDARHPDVPGLLRCCFDGPGNPVGPLCEFAATCTATGGVESVTIDTAQAQPLSGSALPLKPDATTHLASPPGATVATLPGSFVDADEHDAGDALSHRQLTVRSETASTLPRLRPFSRCAHGRSQPHVPLVLVVAHPSTVLHCLSKYSFCFRLAAGMQTTQTGWPLPRINAGPFTVDGAPMAR